MHIDRPGLVLPVRVDPSGVAGPTPKQARGPRWRRTSPGRYVPSTVDGTAVDQRIVEAAAGAPPSAAVTGWAGLRWLRAGWFEGIGSDGTTPLPVPLALGDQRSIVPRPGVVLSEDWLFADDVVEVDGLRITRPERSVAYEALRARWLPRCVQVLDLALAADVVDRPGLTRYLERLAGRPHIRMVKRAAELVSENVWSPRETLMRMSWELEACRPRPLCNVPVFDRDGRHLFTPDLFDPAAGVAGEYDGHVHLNGTARRRDLSREGELREHGIEAVIMMSGDRHDHADFLRRLHAAYRRTEQAPPRGRRTWTLEQPGWWVDTSTVERRRALTPDQRATWLRWQRRT